jgi:hypothetical protein
MERAPLHLARRFQRANSRRFNIYRRAVGAAIRHYPKESQPADRLGLVARQLQVAEQQAPATSFPLFNWPV